MNLFLNWYKKKIISLKQFFKLFFFLLLCLKTARKKIPANVVGDVKGKIAIIVDTIFDDALPFIYAANILKIYGASKVYVCATHGLFSGDAANQINNSCIDEV